MDYIKPDWNPLVKKHLNKLKSLNQILMLLKNTNDTPTHELITQLIIDSKEEFVTDILSNHELKMFNKRAYQELVNPFINKQGNLDEFSSNLIGIKSLNEHTIASIDLDNLKQFNDNFGHEYGDMVLLIISKVIRNYIKDKGKVFRMGGDEFTIWFWTDKEQAIEILNKIKTKLDYVLTLPYNVNTNMGIIKKQHITFSVGVVEGGNDSKLARSLSDDMSYLSKGFGKNRISYAVREVLTIPNIINYKFLSSENIDSEELNESDKQHDVYIKVIIKGNELKKIYIPLITKELNKSDYIQAHNVIKLIKDHGHISIINSDTNKVIEPNSIEFKQWLDQ